MSFPFKTRHAFICGSTDGIGKSTAIKMAELGCEITLIARDKSKLKRTIDQLSTLSEQNHKIVQADFNDPGSLKYEINNHVRMISEENKIFIFVKNTLVNSNYRIPAICFYCYNFRRRNSSHR